MFAFYGTFFCTLSSKWRGLEHHQLPNFWISSNFHAPGFWGWKTFVRKPWSGEGSLIAHLKKFKSPGKFQSYVLSWNEWSSAHFHQLTDLYQLRVKCTKSEPDSHFLFFGTILLFLWYCPCDQLLVVSPLLVQQIFIFLQQSSSYQHEL